MCPLIVGAFAYTDLNEAIDELHGSHALRTPEGAAGLNVVGAEFGIIQHAVAVAAERRT